MNASSYLALGDTIAAISTPPGQSGIGIVRMSGPRSISVAEAVFTAKNGRPLSEILTHTITYGHIHSNGVLIDEVLLTLMRAPRTYTREDIVEINCHGGMSSLRGILEVLLEKGARLAEPGEFTKRAFLNGRIDLAQAEAVLSIIQTKSDRSRQAALSQLQGDLSSKVEEIVDILLNLLTQMEASLNFPEEEISPSDKSSILASLNNAKAMVGGLLKTARAGQYLQEGLKAAILGTPNVGKSTLFNALINKERAIVTQIPGTTRDVIQETIIIGGIPVIVQDTAGIKEAQDIIEESAVSRSYFALSNADIVLMLIDNTKTLTNKEQKLISKSNPLNTIVVFSKCDLRSTTDEREKGKISRTMHTVKISAVTGEGLEELKDEIVGLALKEGIDRQERLFVINARHKRILREADEYLGSAYKSLSEGLSEDVVVSDAKRAMDTLGQITGSVKVTDDVLGKIFSEFCIGK